MMALWRLHERSGLWVHERNVSADEAEAWVRRFRKDEPEAVFVVSSKKPPSSVSPRGIALIAQIRASRYERGERGERHERSARGERHERGENPSTGQQKANRKKTPKRADYGFGLHVEYSPGNAAYFVMWHHEVLSIRPTWEAADEHARALVANKSKDAGGECLTHPSNKLVILKRTQSGEPHVVEHYETMSEAVGAAKRWMRANPPGEHGRITIEARGKGGHGIREFTTEPKNAFEWRWRGWGL
jgi:hypothetical protein